MENGIEIKKLGNFLNRLGLTAVVVVADSGTGGSDGGDSGGEGNGYNYNDRGYRCDNDWQQWLTAVVAASGGCDRRGGWWW